MDSKKKFKYAPLSGSFMAFAMIGFLISAYIVFPESSDFGLALMLVFTAMFVASLIAMHKGPVIK